MEPDFLVNLILVGNVFLGVLFILKSRRWWLPYILMTITFLTLTIGFGISLVLNKESILAYLFVFVVGQLIWAFVFVIIAHVLSVIVRKIPFRHKQQIGWGFLVVFPLSFLVFLFVH
ncbi:hypothetical protein [Rossellomorea aquimaris]|uniref:hypothetical protein n=1 Tax=Rossellomorea aquimaris TaxID=189382 RepID=UPI0007D077CA|nr:hypothetical protein [Rossellomorea aquimaris]